MGQFSHPNMVKLYGVVTVGDPVSACVKLLINVFIKVKKIQKLTCCDCSGYDMYRNYG